MKHLVRKYVILLLVGVVATNTHAQLRKHLAPVNDDFKTQVANLKNGIAPEISIYGNLGYVAPYASFPETGVTSGNDDVVFKSAELATLPAKFDLRAFGMITSVKNQGSGNFGGNCWTFGSIGAIESEWLLMGAGDFDLSEQNMAACHGFEWAYGEGGNEFLTMSYLSKLKGPLSESDDPYNTNVHACKANKKAMAFAPDVRFIYNNPLNTKRVLMTYGAVTSNIYWSDKFYNKKDYTYYSNNKLSPNHQILIVGWDDTKVTAAGKGAWIAKNSWSESWGDGGFFYISYSDKKILNPIAYYPVRWDYESVSATYFYDEIGLVTFSGFSRQYAYALTKYTTPKEQYITRVGTFVARSGSSLEFEVYAAKDADTLKNLITSLKTRQLFSPGFYTFNLPFKANGDFYIKVKYTTPGIKYPIPIEIKSDTYADPQIEPSGKQWISKDGKVWQALGSDIENWQADLVIHAYASDVPGPKANFEASKYEVCAGSSLTFTDKSFGTVDSYFWDFGADATPSTATGIGPHNVAFSDNPVLGVHTVSLKVKSGNDSSTVLKEIKLVNQLTTLFAAPNYVILGDTAEITCVGDGETYTWKPTNNLITNTGRTVTFVSDSSFKFKITVVQQQGTCKGSATLDMDVRTPPSNDEPCNALELVAGNNGPFTNVDATAYFNEPFPEDSDCYLDKTWCDEGGVQNSVWFTVKAPASGKLTLTTSGFDTQIALYKSDSCSSIQKSDLIAANDDYFTDAPYAAAIELATVLPGEMYFVQLDGSAGGATGTFYINVSDQAVGIDNTLKIRNRYLEVYPNPSNGLTHVRYNSPQNSKLLITVTDVTGKIVFTNNLQKVQRSVECNLNLNTLPKGIYFLSVNAKNDFQTVKVVIE